MELLKLNHLTQVVFFISSFTTLSLSQLNNNDNIIMSNQGKETINVMTCHLNNEQKQSILHILYQNTL